MTKLSPENFPFDEFDPSSEPPVDTNTPYPIEDGTAWLFNPLNPDYMADLHRDNDDNQAYGFYN